MKIKNEAEIQLMKIMFKTQKKKPTKNLTSKRAYPYGVEQKYYHQLQLYFKPLTDYVKKYLNENLPQILRGDSGDLHLDAIPGNAFDKMLFNLENWLSIYMPDISELPEDSNNNVIYAGLGKTANETMEFSEKQFKKIIEKGIHVNLPTTADWWDKMKTSWADDNYTLITSNAKKYVSQINSIVEQGVVNGLGVGKITEQIFNATDSLTKKHCKLLARDQIGKLHGQINQAQSEELGLELYVWDTAMDDRVRDSHAVMQGLLCRWDDASVCSYDNGKTWVPRPATAVDLHPGQDIQCRCSGLTFYPELIAEVENIELEEATEDLPPVQEEFKSALKDIITPEDFVKNAFDVSDKKYFEGYIKSVYDDTNEAFNEVMSKISSQYKKSILYVDTPGPSEFVPETQKIILRKKNMSLATFRHEMSHFLDYLLGSRGQIVYINHQVGLTRWNFSKYSQEFQKTYLKELNIFVNDIKADIKKKFGVTTVTIDNLDDYLFELNLNERERNIIKDMFTARDKKDFGGHLASYFIDIERVMDSKDYINDKVLSEGFSELCETYYGKSTSKLFNEFLNKYFSKSIPIINKQINNFIK